MSHNEDTECLDSWESLEDPKALDKEIEKISSKCTADKNSTKNASTGLSSVILLNTDGQMRFGPPPPGVKILKRPNGFNHNIQIGDDRPKAPIKSLQQREVEYAKARERILGEANNQTEPGPTEILTKSMKIYNENQQLEKPLERRLIQVETRQGPIFGPYRPPRGPDGTAGFQTNR